MAMKNGHSSHATAAAVPKARVRGDLRSCPLANLFQSAADGLAAKARDYLANEAGIAVSDVHVAIDNVEHLKLRELTAVIGVGGDVGVLVAVSFSQPMADALFARLTAGLTIPPGQEADFREATVTEAANVIIGHCTGDFEKDGSYVSLSPPILLEDARSIFRMKNAKFGTVQITSPQGAMDIHLIGPRGIFDEVMNYRGVP